MTALLLNRWAQLAAAIALSLMLGFGLGHHQKTLEDAASNLKAAQKAVQTVSASSAATAKASQQTAVQQARTADVTLSNLQKVKAYVPPAADSQCIVGVGAVRLLNAAAQDQPVPEPAIGVQDANSGVALSELVQDDVINAGTYHDLSERLRAWDDWYDAQKAIADGR